MSNIQNMSLEDIMGERFGRYSKYIIQERALPDIRDGLKPVQRRILYSMNKDGNTFEKGFRKSAKSVGNVMGNFHPHGDSSIYDAMVRMSQDWKNRETLIEMHGNNGSMDGDPAAAMRYTEARLSEIAGYLLQDIDKNTVPFAWNFDDTEKEPTVLPAAFPNLLVNGATGISAGYATDIPPHNLAEVIDAVVYMIDHPKAKLDKLMEFLPGPDFPTGAIIQGKDEIRKAYETGKGRVAVRSRTAIETLKGGKKQIIVTEIPYEVNKSVLVKRIDDVRVNNKVPGIAEVRDESDRDGLRIAIELKKEADETIVLNYLFKYTDLQVNYNFNMVAIDDYTPKQQVGLSRILTSYIAHRREIIIARSKFDKEKAEKRLHIVEGLIRVLSILDEVIALIRASENKADAKENLKVSYEFSEAQAEAIVTLQLYRLTNTDIVTLREEEEELRQQITMLKAIISDERTMYNVMKRELREVKKKFANTRRSELQELAETIEIDTASLIIEEDTYVSVTRGGYVKRTSPRSFNASTVDELGKREDDELIFVSNAKTTQHLLMFTNLGNLAYRPVHELADIRWKDVGEHLSQNLVNFASNEEIIYAELVDDFTKETYFAVTSLGQIKRFERQEISPWRTYKSKTAKYAKLKNVDDYVVTVAPIQLEDVILVTYNGYALRFSINDVPVVGSKAAGVKAMNLKDSDHIVSAFIANTTSLYLLTHRGSLKRMAIDVIPTTSRANRGLQVLRELKSKPHRVFKAGPVYLEDSSFEFDLFSSVSNHEGDTFVLEIMSKTGKVYDVDLSQWSFSERTSNGSFVSDKISDEGVFSVKIK